MFLLSNYIFYFLYWTRDPILNAITVAEIYLCNTDAKYLSRNLLFLLKNVGLKFSKLLPQLY